MIIDWQHHASPKVFFDRRGGKAGAPVMQNGKVNLRLRPEVYQIDMQLDYMDAAGIDMSVLSATLENHDDCSITGEFYAEVMRDHPDRFAGLAPCLPLHGPEALAELEHAVNELGLKGVVISPQNSGEAMDSQKMWPFYELVQKLDVPIFVHISGVPVGYDALEADWNINVTMTREFDVASNAIRLVNSGVLTKFPGLNFVIAHFGGGVSSIYERVERYVYSWGDRFWEDQGGKAPFAQPYKQSFREVFDRLYFDMAGFEGGMNAVNCALTTIRPDRLLFATDYPYNFSDDPEMVKQYVENIRTLNLAPEIIDGILGGTAAQLLKL